MNVEHLWIFIACESNACLLFEMLEFASSSDDGPHQGSLDMVV